MKFKKTLDFLLVGIFALALILPLAFADFEGGKVSVAENRRLAPFPELVVNGKPKLKRSEINNWINDNIGGRSLATGIHTRLTYDLFGLSAKTDTLIGKENWTFYYTQDILNDYTGTNLLSEERLQTITEDLNTIREYAEEKGTTVQFVIAPDKKTIYSEYYPDGIKKAAGVTRSRQLTEYISNHTDIPAYSLEEVLLNSKSLGTLYSPRIDNAHWNLLGGYVGYTAMMRELSKQGIDVSWIDISECDIQEYQAEGLFNEAVKIRETAYTVRNEKTDSVMLRQEEMDRFPFLSFNNDPDMYKKYYVNADEKLPSLLFVGDSYSQKLFEYLPQSFSRVMFVHSADLPLLYNILAGEEFDAIIIESAERMLDYEFALLSSCAERIRGWNREVIESGVIESIPIRETQETYQYLDYTSDKMSEGDIIYVDTNNTVCYGEGWARDPIAGKPAGKVVIQAGDTFQMAEYGKERQSVRDYFGDDAYLNTGYTFLLNLLEIRKTDTVIVHVISADGQYRYPPVYYRIEYMK